MIKHNFVNKMYESSLVKIEDDRSFFIREATENADMNAILAIANVKYIDVLKYEDLHTSYIQYFRNILKCVVTEYMKDGDDDFINKGIITFIDYKDAAEFLVGCKLFIKVSSDYDLTVCKGEYTFTFNYDRLDSDVL